MFSSTESSARMPSARRFSEEYTTPSDIALRGESRCTDRPSIRMMPASRCEAPVRARASSVRPEPSSPASPTISASPRSTSAAVMPRAARDAARAEEHRRLGRDDRLALARLEVRDVVPEHLVHQVDAQQLAGEVLPDQRSVAQHGDPVADLVDLVQEVRDEQDRDAASLQLADDPEQLAHLVQVEARGGLVEDEHAHVGGDGPRDRDELLDRHRVRAEDGRRVDVEPEVGEDLGWPGRASAAG